MPASTPIYAFTYPCPGETVGAASFATLANQIDAKLVDLNNDYTLGLNRFSSDTSAAAVQSIPSGVETTLTSLGTSYTIPVAGIWVIEAAVVPTSSPATITVERLRIFQNATPQFGFTQNTESNSTRTVVAAGPIVGAIGDVITIRFTHTGSAAMNVDAHISAKMLVKIA